MIRTFLESEEPEQPSSGKCGRAATVRQVVQLDAKAIVLRLEAAGATLLAMPSKGYTTRLSRTNFDIIHTALEAYGWQAALARPPVPSANEISLMDEAYSWLSLLPQSQFVLRRIVSARSLVHPVTGRYLFPWRRLAATLGADHKSVQRWHAQAIVLLVKRLPIFSSGKLDPLENLITSDIN